MDWAHAAAVRSSLWIQAQALEAGGPGPHSSWVLCLNLLLEGGGLLGPAVVLAGEEQSQARANGCMGHPDIRY